MPTDNPLEFLNVTFYVNDTTPMKAFYAEFLRLPLNFEQPGELAAMGPVTAHDTSEGDSVGSLRLYFLADDVSAVAAIAAARGIAGTVGTDGFGNDMWDGVDPMGTPVRVLTRG